MKLTPVLASELFFSGIFASPISNGATENPVASNETTLQSNNSTDISLEGMGRPGPVKFCFHQNQKDLCHGGSFKKCVKYQSAMPTLGVEGAPSFCAFWCTKMKKTEDCGFNKQKYNYEPKWSCENADFTC
ncbi:putative secreted protein [Wickerhamomyces ciferrii]|uniref:Secreted protein n=1 Tax=Wickerhamomyces ciferrii (strain ATCC 14091 / BCRC 22168 / CBS 111 / JCM 3599 / NBRC 0793 / NRRL Y-1031 F-60-10) TaxID=1206466 RepID=K0KWX5_WICCF|nr:uncharacterized protein BN7_6140 [Wickerhamomyces ciferrii]CCH46547.1 putative secreted protein [Wickerhamomyces ciferrii]